MTPRAPSTPTQARDPSRPHQIILAHFDRVRNANNRLVLAETEIVSATREYAEARHALARMVADYGVEGLVDGERPPQIMGTDDE